MINYQENSKESVHQENLDQKSISWQEQKILITGGLGFIGSALIYTLNKLGLNKIIICDNFRKKEKWKNVRNLNFLEVIAPSKIFDFLEKTNASNPRETEKVATIFHLGACSDTREADMDFLYENNFLFSKKLYEYSLRHKTHFIYASSAATYGAKEKDFFETTPLNELTPINKYGYSKQLFDKWVQLNLPDWIDSIKTTAHILAGIKFFNVFGPNEYHKDSMASVVYHGFNQIKKNGRIKLFKSYRDSFADGEQKRDFIYVKDACAALIALTNNINLNQRRLLKQGKFLYNLGSTQARSFNQLVKPIFEALKIKPDIEYIEMPEDLRNRYQYFTKAEMDWGFPLPFTSKENYLEATVSDYVLNHLNAQEPYLSL